MEHEFWRERWEQGQLGFHLAEANPMLARFWPRLELSGGRVLVPLCGKSLDVGWLAARGHDVWGVEFVQTAVDAYFAERNVEPEREQVDGFSLSRGAGVTLVTADFFRVHTGVTGIFDGVYDRGAWVAIAPVDRRRYTEQLGHLVKPGGQVLLVNFEHDVGSGPPHSTAAEELHATWQEFSLERIFEHDILVEEPRFRERGATRFLEQVWIGVRKS